MSYKINLFQGSFLKVHSYKYKMYIYISTVIYLGAKQLLNIFGIKLAFKYILGIKALF